jgi:hypothetical protein
MPRRSPISHTNRARRALPLALAAILALAVVSPVAGGGKPESFPQEKIEQLFESCGFQVALADTFAAGRILIFPTGDDGSTKIISAGGFKSTLWNVEHPEIRIDVKFFGHLDIVIRPNGDQVVRQGGQALWWFDTASDAAMFGLTPGVYIFTGRVEALLDEDSVAIAPARMHARVRNLCAELAA